MSTRHLIAVLVAAAVAWSTSAIAAENENAEGDDDDAAEVRLKLDQVPDAVRESLLKEAAGAKFDGVEREVEDGKTVYEIEVVIDGKTWAIEVDETGKLLERELEDAEDNDAEKNADGDDAIEAKKDATDKSDDSDAPAAAKSQNEAAEDDDDADEAEEQVTLDELPAAVRKALTEAAGKGKIGEIEKETEEGRTVYEAEVTLDGKTWEITFDFAGKVLEKELDDDEEEDENDDD